MLSSNAWRSLFFKTGAPELYLLSRLCGGAESAPAERVKSA
jgi:hypothetical protein